MEYKSHPVWVRGLKHVLICYNVSISPSHPVWVRGLKLIILTTNHKSRPSRTPCGCVD